MNAIIPKEAMEEVSTIAVLINEASDATIPTENQPLEAATAMESDGNPSHSSVAPEAESFSPGDRPSNMTQELPTEGRQIIIIDPPASITRRRESVTRSLLVVATEHQATVASSNGHAWSVGQAHIDSPKSSKYGISLAAGLHALGIEQLQRGDLVQIEIGRNETCYHVTGRASRKAAAYFAKTDLVEAGVEVHTPFHFVVLGVESQSQVEGRQS